MKILFISDGISPYVVGGMQKHSFSFSRQLVLNGHDVTLIHCVFDDVIPTEEEVNHLFFNGENSFDKIFGICFPKGIKYPGHYIYRSFIYSKLIYKLFEQSLNEYDFIYTKGFSGWKIISEKYKEKINVKVGVKFHGYEMYQYAPNFKIKLQHFMLRPFVKYLNRKSDIVFSYGGKITKIISRLGVPNSKIIEIPSAINQNWLSQKQLSLSSPIKFLFVGRYERRKGINELNKVIKHLSKENVKAEFHFIGPIPNSKKLKLSNIKVFYYGLIKDELKKKSIYDLCDILLCPSYSEGMPNVILEGMSRGMIVISTNVGAISNMVNLKNGFLINKLSVKTLLNAIKIFLTKDNDELLTMKYESINKVKSSFLLKNIAVSMIEKIK